MIIDNIIILPNSICMSDIKGFCTKYSLNSFHISFIHMTGHCYIYYVAITLCFVLKLLLFVDINCSKLLRRTSVQ